MKKKKLTDNEMVEYLQDTSSNIGIIIFAIVMLIAGICNLYFCFTGDFSIKSLLISLFLCVFSAIILWTFLFSKDPYPELVQSLKGSGEMEIALADFQSAQAIYSGLRMGNTYIFRMNSQKLIRYDEITQVWQLIKKKNGIETSRELKYRDVNGEVNTLCDLARKGKANDDVVQIMTILKARNPVIHLGYE